MAIALGAVSDVWQIACPLTPFWCRRSATVRLVSVMCG
jgi:hypothetical protein